jgi:hypothetical protein
MKRVRKIEFNKREEATERKECKMSSRLGFLNGVVRVKNAIRYNEVRRAPHRQRETKEHAM